MSNKENTDEAADVGKKLKSITDYVRDCQARVTKGEILDLHGLDKNVMEVCNALAGLPEKEGRIFENQMNLLIEKFEILASTMKAQQDRFIASGGR